VARDGTWVIWRLKPVCCGMMAARYDRGIDVIFNPGSTPPTPTTSGHDRRLDTATSSASSGLDRPSHEVKLVFKGPTPFWADAFCSNAGNDPATRGPGQAKNKRFPLTLPPPSSSRLAPNPLLRFFLLFSYG